MVWVVVVAWFDWLLGVDDVVGVVLGVLGVLWVEAGAEVCAGVEVVGVGALVVVCGEVVVAGVQLTLKSVAPAGREGAPPGDKSTVSVEIEPSSNLIVTTQGSAEEADGRAAMPITTAIAVIAPTTSFRLRNTVVNLLPRVCSSKSLAPRPQAAWRGRYCLTPWFATVNRRPRRPSRERQPYPVAGPVPVAARRRIWPQPPPERYGSRALLGNTSHG